MEKNNFIQMWRGIAMCAVVLIHCVWQMDNSNLIAFSYSIIFRQCLNFAVGTFMFFAGYFVDTKKFESKAYLFKRIKRLAIPYLIWSSLYIANEYISGDLSSIQEVIIMYLNGTAAPQLYYIVVLLQLTILTPLVIKLDKYKYAKYIMWLISPIYYIIMYCADFQIPMRQTWFVAWFIFYYAGIKLQKAEVRLKTGYIFVCMIGALCLSVASSFGLLNFYNNYGIAVTQMKISSILFAFSIIIFICRYKDKYISNKNIFVKLGDMSYGIFYIHVFALTIPGAIFSLLNPPLPLVFLQFIELVSALGISYIVLVIMKKVLRGKSYLIGV